MFDRPQINKGWDSVFNTTFNNISVISLRSVLLVGETGVPEKTIDLPQYTHKLYYIMLYRVHLAMKRVLTYIFRLSNRVENRNVISYSRTACMLHVREGKIVMLAWSQKTVAIFINRNNFKILKGLSEVKNQSTDNLMFKTITTREHKLICKTLHR